MQRRILVLSICVLAAGALAPLSNLSAEAPALTKGSRTAGVSVGIALGDTRWGGKREHDALVGQVHYDVAVSDLLATDRFYRGRVFIGADFLFARQYEPDSGILFGLTPIVRYVFDTGGAWLPFVEGGIGVAVTDVGEPAFGGKLQFNPQAGAGVHWFVRQDVAITFQQRFVHYSNGGLRSPNSGVNQHMSLIGISRTF